MSARYARAIATVGGVVTWIVIRTDEVAPHELRARGFEPILEELSDEDVRAAYGVREIYTVTDRRIVVM